MKQTPILDRAQALMQPGVLTASGMLGDDPRRLVDILEADDAEVRRLGLSHEAIAARLRALRRAGTAGLGDPVDVPPNFQVRVESIRGRLSCPYKDGLVSKSYTTVRNTRLGREVVFTDLNVHLIAVHGFYLGRGAPYRLDPAELAAVLELAPE